MLYKNSTKRPLDIDSTVSTKYSESVQLEHCIYWTTILHASLRATFNSYCNNFQKKYEKL